MWTLLFCYYPDRTFFGRFRFYSVGDQKGKTNFQKRIYQGKIIWTGVILVMTLGRILGMIL